MSRNKQENEAFYSDTFKTLICFSATWDRFMQVDEIEKHLIEIELDSIRTVLNEQYGTDVWRGATDRTGIFTTGMRK